MFLCPQRDTYFDRAVVVPGCPGCPKKVTVPASCFVSGDFWVISEQETLHHGMVLRKLSEQLQLVNSQHRVLGAHPDLCLSLTEGPQKYLQQPQSAWGEEQQRIQQQNGTNCFWKSEGSYVIYGSRDKLVLDFAEGLSQDTVKNVNMSLTWVSVKYLKSLNVFFKAIIIGQKDK